MNLLVQLILCGYFLVAEPMGGPAPVPREAIPAQQVQKILAAPDLRLNVDEAGTLSGTFRNGKKQTFGEKGHPNLEILATSLKALPEDKSVELKVHDDVPQKLLAEIMKVLIDEVGLENVTITNMDR
jgi:hypothetical protein